MGPLSQEAGKWGRSGTRGKPSVYASSPAGPWFIQAVLHLEFHTRFCVSPGKWEPSNLLGQIPSSYNSLWLGRLPHGQNESDSGAAMSWVRLWEMLPWCVGKGKAWLAEGRIRMGRCQISRKATVQSCFFWSQFCIKHKDKDYMLKNRRLLNKCTVRALY